MMENCQATLQYSSNSRDSFNDKFAKGAQDWFCIHVIIPAVFFTTYDIN